MVWSSLHDEVVQGNHAMVVSTPSLEQKRAQLREERNRKSSPKT